MIEQNMKELNYFYRKVILWEVSILGLALFACGMTLCVWIVNFGFDSDSKFITNTFIEDFVFRYVLIIICILVVIFCTYRPNKIVFTSLGVIALIFIAIQSIVLVSLGYGITKFELLKYGSLLRITFYLDIVMGLLIIPASISYISLKKYENSRP